MAFAFLLKESSISLVFRLDRIYKISGLNYVDFDKLLIEKESKLIPKKSDTAC